MTRLSDQITELYKDQALRWPQFSDALNGLKSVVTKSFEISGDQCLAQFNPARIRSTAAATDKKSIKNRACFLCSQNRPVEQREVTIESFNYSFLVNPFPVLDLHFTVICKEHILQKPVPYLADFFSLADKLGEDWAVVFNGARAGASAPDHLHFQTFPATHLPLYHSVQQATVDFSTAQQIFTFADTHFVLLVSSNLSEIKESLTTVLAKLVDTELLNLICWQHNGRFLCFVMPRSKHRPDCYFEQGAGQLLLSPGAIEICGIWIFPREQDFLSVSTERISQIAQEVTCSEEFVRSLI